MPMRSLTICMLLVGKITLQNKLSLGSENTRFLCFVVCSMATFHGLLKFDPKFDYIHLLHIGPTILHFIDTF